MLEFFGTFADALFSAFNFFLNFVTGILTFFRLVLEFISYLTVVIGYLPAPLIVFCLMGIFMSVLLLIVGRN